MYKRQVRDFTISPQSYGFELTAIDALRGGPPTENALALTELLGAQHSAYRDIVLLNSGAALMIAGIATDIAAGIDMAAASIDDGKARKALDDLIKVSNG